MDFSDRPSLGDMYLWQHCPLMPLPGDNLLRLFTAGYIGRGPWFREWPTGRFIGAIGAGQTLSLYCGSV